MTAARSFVTYRLPGGGAHVETVWERGRHQFGERFELGPGAELTHDGTTHPYSNWGCPTRLAWVLERAAAELAQRAETPSGVAIGFPSYPTGCACSPAGVFEHPVSGGCSGVTR